MRALALGVIAVAAAAATGAQQQQQPRIFRGATTVVAIPVSVSSGNRAVSDLALSDFVVTDNGVRQRLLDVGSADQPVDVSLVAHLRFGLDANWQQFRADAEAIAKRLRPVDSLGVTITAAVAEVRSTPRTVGGVVPSFDELVKDPWGSAASMAAARNLAVYGDEPPPAQSGRSRTVTSVGGGSAIYDAIARALMQRVPRNRRHLVVAFTDGLDRSSVLTAAQLFELAKRAEAVLVVARPGPIPRVPSSASRDSLWVPDPAALTEIAIATGGQDTLQSAWPGATNSYLRAFDSILEQFRQSFVLYYEPEGVSPGGWHEVTVTVPAHSRYTIRARRGYVGVAR